MPIHSCDVVRANMVPWKQVICFVFSPQSGQESESELLFFIFPGRILQAGSRYQQVISRSTSGPVSVWPFLIVSP